MGTSSSTATPRGVTWRGGGTWLPPGYSCPPRGLQTAAHTSATNSWGKANSPSTESRAQASAAAVGLHFAISTMVAAAGGVGSGGGGGGCRAGGARSSTHPARSRGCPCSSPAGRPRGARLLPPRRWAVGGMGCQAWGCPVRHGPPQTGAGGCGGGGGASPPPAAWLGPVHAVAAFPSHWTLGPRAGTCCCSASSARSYLSPTVGWEGAQGWVSKEKGARVMEDDQRCPKMMNVHPVTDIQG